MEILPWIKKRIGPRGRRFIRLLIELWLWSVSFAPSHLLRVIGLRLSGAKIGRNVAIGRGIRVLHPWRLSIGSNTILGLRVCLDGRGSLTIGNNCNIADEIAIWTAEHDIQSPDFVMTEGAVVVGDRAWICHRSILLPGITIGEGSVVASGSVVTKDIPAFSVAAGIPARVIGKRNANLRYKLGRNVL